MSIFGALVFVRGARVKQYAFEYNYSVKNDLSK